MSSKLRYYRRFPRVSIFVKTGDSTGLTSKIGTLDFAVKSIIDLIERNMDYYKLLTIDNIRIHEYKQAYPM